MKTEKQKSTKCAGAIVMYIAAVFVFLVGAASATSNVLYFNKTVAEYVAQGYPKAMVQSELIVTSLLPALFQAVGIYLGIALGLFGIGLLNQKLFAVKKAAEAAAGSSEDDAAEEEATLPVSETETAETAEAETASEEDKAE